MKPTDPAQAVLPYPGDGSRVAQMSPSGDAFTARTDPVGSNIDFPFPPITILLAVVSRFEVILASKLLRVVLHSYVSLDP